MRSKKPARRITRHMDGFVPRHDGPLRPVLLPQCPTVGRVHRVPHTVGWHPRLYSYAPLGLRAANSPTCRRSMTEWGSAERCNRYCLRHRPGHGGGIMRDGQCSPTGCNIGR
ncbi:MAG: hypothetical protein IJU72_10765 [Bacteroidales bacterium]|nr:hypothetical protein [Bacteroidales bacterium]